MSIQKRKGLCRWNANIKENVSEGDASNLLKGRVGKNSTAFTKCKHMDVNLNALT